MNLIISLLSLWSIDMLQGVMLQCHSKIKEQAASNYTHLTEHKIR